MSDPLFDAEQARAHLTMLHAGIGGFLDVRTLPALNGKIRHPCATVSGAVSIAEYATLHGRNVHVGVAPRCTGGLGKGEGGAKNLVASRYVWADYDFSHVPNAAPGYDHARAWCDPAAREELHIRLEQLDLEPSFIIWSGGGAHVYLELEEPFVLETPQQITRFESITRGLCRKLQADLSSCDAARILRIAGSMNFKRAPATPCVVAGWRP